MTRKLLFLFLFIPAFLFGQATIWTESFDDATQYSVTLGGEGTDGTSDYFFRTDGTNIGISYTGNTGTFFAGQDIDDTGWANSANPSQLTWTNIDISTFTSIEFSALFASAATGKIDDNDYLLVEYQVDGGGWTNLIAFENDGTQYNTFFLEDTDFSGDGDGTQLTSTFQSFTKSIPDGGLLDLRLTAAVNSGGEDFAIDEIQITGISAGGVTNPNAFAVSAVNSSQIDVTFTLNDDTDNILIVYDTDNTFTDPSGAPPAAGQAFAGGTVVYYGLTSPQSHTGLSANQIYYYKAFSYDGSNYSAGLEANATTYKAEPTNHVSTFTANAADVTISLTWTDNDGAIAADGFLIIGSDVSYAAITDPSDGNPPAEDTDLSDGAGAVFVGTAIQTYNFEYLGENTQYYFKIYPYTNADSHSDFKVDGTIPTATATTGTAPAIIPDPGYHQLIISEVVGDGANGDNGDDDGFAEIYNPTTSTVQLTNVQIRYYNSNPGAPTTAFDLSGDIAAGEFLVITQDNTGFTATHGFAADFAAGGSFYFNGGDDGVDLYNSNTGATIDQFNGVGAGSTPFNWTDSYVYERTDTSADGTALTAWTEITSGTGTPGTSNANAPLPVELTTFSASVSGDAVTLSWETATEVNNYGFEIERSAEEAEWSKIGFVAGSGNSSSPKQYTFSDSKIGAAEKYSYRLKQVDMDGTFSYSEAVEVTVGAPSVYSLEQNYPNPFNPTTTIKFQLAEAGNVKLTVFNTIGEKVTELINKNMEAGYHTMDFDASMLNSGVYLYTLESNGFRSVKKMILLK